VKINTDDIGRIAELGKTWHEILDVRKVENKIQYKLFPIDQWIPEDWIVKIKDV